MRLYKLNAEKSFLALFFKAEQGAEGRGNLSKRVRNFAHQMHVSVISINGSSVNPYEHDIRAADLI